MIKFPQIEEKPYDFSEGRPTFQGGFYKDLKSLRDAKYV
jgi:hypothetical protein